MKESINLIDSWSVSWMSDVQIQPIIVSLCKGGTYYEKYF